MDKMRGSLLCEMYESGQLLVLCVFKTEYMNGEVILK